MANTDYWRDLTRFESHDYVGRWYRQRHARSLSAGRTREIISCFTQGREYFFSAKQSATAVKPLLLYYGVLAFSRGLILLLDPRKTEASLKPSHGIEIVDWQGTLAGGLENMLDVGFRDQRNVLRTGPRNRKQTANVLVEHAGSGGRDFPRDLFHPKLSY